MQLRQIDKSARHKVPACMIVCMPHSRNHCISLTCGSLIDPSDRLAKSFSRLREMSAFIRRQPIGAAVDVGTRPGLHGQMLISSGVADLDRLLGGGLPLGSLLLLLEDPHSQHHLNFIKYFLAEGVACRHSTCWLAPQQQPGGAAAFLPPVAQQQDSSSQVRIRGINFASSCFVEWQPNGKHQHPTAAASIARIAQLPEM